MKSAAKQLKSKGTDSHCHPISTSLPSPVAMLVQHLGFVFSLSFEDDIKFLGTYQCTESDSNHL